jgi:hypothetical protein
LWIGLLQWTSADLHPGGFQTAAAAAYKMDLETDQLTGMAKDKHQKPTKRIAE